MTVDAVRAMLTEWQALRLVLAEVERAEHPDITDEYGRVWVWRSGDLYSHDRTLAMPAALIPRAGLPSPRLAENPNYDRLCSICRTTWPVVQLELFQARYA